MTRSVTIWRTWDGCDMAESDVFFATKADAVKNLKEMYDLTLSDLKPNGKDELSCDSPKYGDVHLAKVKIELTRHDVAAALTFLPNR